MCVRIPETALTCSDIQLAGLAARSFDQALLATLSDAEFKDCAEQLGDIDSWTSGQLTQLGRLAKKVGVDDCLTYSLLVLAMTQAEKNRRQPFLYVAIHSRSCVFIFWVYASLAMVRWYVSFGCPLFLFTDGFQYHACFCVLGCGILRTPPKYIHILFNMFDLIGCTSVLLRVI